MWCEPVHCSLFFQHHHNACTIAEPNHTYRTHFSFYAGTLIEVLPQCVIRKLYRSSRSTSHRSNIECSPSPDSNWTAHHMKRDISKRVLPPSLAAVIKEKKENEKEQVAAKEGSAPSPKVSKTFVLLLHHSAISVARLSELSTVYSDLSKEKRKRKTVLRIFTALLLAVG